MLPLLQKATTNFQIRFPEEVMIVCAMDMPSEKRPALYNSMLPVIAAPHSAIEIENATNKLFNLTDMSTPRIHGEHGR